MSDWILCRKDWTINSIQEVYDMSSDRVEVQVAKNGYVLQYWDNNEKEYVTQIHTQFDSMVHALKKVCNG